jgi:hypothetical protein
MKEERKKYEIPSMERNLVELEDGFCAASVDVKNPQGEFGEIEAHDVNMGFGDAGNENGAADFSGTEWK